MPSTPSSIASAPTSLGLALVQVAWPGGIALVDPLAVNPELFTKLFDSDAVAVLHAAQQDLDVLTHAVGSVPRVIYDTQVAAGFIGYATPSLVELVRGELGQSPAKGDRLTDWLHRPLTADQKEYAAADVRYLLDLQDHIDAKLIERGRLAWAVEAFDELRSRPTGRTAPEDAWARLKDARTLRPRARAVAQAVAAWRERRGPGRWTFRFARCCPTWPCSASLSANRPTSPSSPSVVASTTATVADGSATSSSPSSRRPSDAPAAAGRQRGRRLDRSLRPALTLISAWVSQVART